MKRAFYIIGGLTLAISIPSALQAQTTQPKDPTMNRTVAVSYTHLDVYKRQVRQKYPSVVLLRQILTYTFFSFYFFEKKGRQRCV